MNIKIKDHFNVKYFNEFSLELKYDSVGSTFAFSLYFDPNSVEHRILWQPTHYHVVTVEHNGEQLIKGFVLNQSFGSESKKRLASISGYSLTGVLEDCQIPTKLYPLQSDGKTLKEIAEKLLSEFKLGLQVDESVSSKVNSVFDKTTASETQTIKEYLNSIAAQKNVILSHTPDGKLLFTKANTNTKPIYHFADGHPATSIELSINGQAMHSHITVQKQASIDGGNASEQTIENPYVQFVYRPLVKTQTSGTDNDSGDAARNVLSSELKNIVLKITTNVWEIDGKIIKPNSIISVTSPENYLFEKTNWFVESVSLKGNEKETTAVLTCVLPEVYNQETVKNIFGNEDWKNYKQYITG